ncbi:M16 family metallopeptidase [Acinetobacter sp. WZC-1]|uniref:M16 family metallopeptidase n=1 Tax=Acinetobacter sp. WZC-1 TaxID=3459034 RepID=UPI00403DE76C
MNHSGKTMPVHALFALFCLTLGCSIPAFAEFEINDQHTELTTTDTPLKSIAVLQSLKNLPRQKENQAPFVQELHNASRVRTLFVSNQALPIVDIQLTFNAGSARDESIGKGLYGLSSMAARLMTEGTEQYSAQQIARTFDGLGAQFSVNAYRDMFVVRLRVLSDPAKLEPAIDLMMDLLNHATFNHSGLNLALNNSRVGQKQIQENPARLMNIDFYRAIYGEHPYAEPSTGTQAGIRKITPELLIQFRSKLLVAKNMNIAMTGNLTSEQATALAAKISTSLPQGTPVAPLPEAVDQNDFKIQVIPFNSSQAHVMIGQIGIARTDPDRIALEVANQMFGGSGFNSVLMKELRVKRGYTYGAYSTLTSTQSRGLFSFSYSTQQDQLMDSIRVAHQALIDFVSQPIDRKQLEETREGMLRAFPMTFSSNAGINAQIAAIGFYGLAADYLTQYQQQLSSLTPMQLQNAIQKHLRADRLTLVIVADTLDQAALQELLQEDLNPFSHPQQAVPDHPPAPQSRPTDPPLPSQDTVLPETTQPDTPASV